MNNDRWLEIELNNAWWGHGDVKYEDKLMSVKIMGYKVFRDSQGNHKVQKVNNDNAGNIFDLLFGGKYGQ